MLSCRETFRKRQQRHKLDIDQSTGKVMVDKLEEAAKSETQQNR